jgi:ABC-type uncharacterized transport system permease subunit
MTNAQLWSGIGMQVLWIVSGIVILNFIWNFAIKQYSAVGG